MIWEKIQMPKSSKNLLKDTDAVGKPSPHGVETQEMFDRILNAQFGRLCVWPESSAMQLHPYGERKSGGRNEG